MHEVQQVHGFFVRYIGFSHGKSHNKAPTSHDGGASKRYSKYLFLLNHDLESIINVEALGLGLAVELATAEVVPVTGACSITLNAPDARGLAKLRGEGAAAAIDYQVALKGRHIQAACQGRLSPQGILLHHVGLQLLALLQRQTPHRTEHLHIVAEHRLRKMLSLVAVKQKKRHNAEFRRHKVGVPTVGTLCSQAGNIMEEARWRKNGFPVLIVKICFGQHLVRCLEHILYHNYLKISLLQFLVC